MPLVAACGAGEEEDEELAGAAVIGPVNSAMWGWERTVLYHRMTLGKDWRADVSKACTEGDFQN